MLRDVRIINLLQDTLFWFKVDSQLPGCVRQDLQGIPFRETTEVSSSVR